MERRVVFAVMSIVAIGTGCADDHSGPRGGTAAGLRARVRIDGMELSSAEAEVRLDPSENEPLAPRRAELAGASRVVGPHVRPAARRDALPVALDDVPRAACPGLGEAPDRIGTVDGSVCWVSTTFTAGSLIEENALYYTQYFAREGIYNATMASVNVYYPPDFGHYGALIGVGCVKSPDGDTISSDYLESMSPLSTTYGIGPYVTGFSAFIVPGQGFIPAIEYDTGAQLTASLFPWPIAITMTLMVKSRFTTRPTLHTPWAECAELGTAPGFRAGPGGALAVIADGLRDLAATPGADGPTELRTAMAESFSPVFDLLTTSSGMPPQDDAIAGTQADLFADFLGREGASLCEDCPAMSLDRLLFDFDRRVTAAGDDSDAILAAGVQAADLQVQISPQLMLQSELQRRASPGVALGRAVHDEVTASTADLYSDARIISIAATVGTPADLSIDAVEIAALIGVDEAALEGATVTIDGEPVVEPADVDVVDGQAEADYTPQNGAPIVFRYSVDLSTAVGPLPDGAEAWIVRPALRRVEPAAGPPAELVLTAPYHARLDSPVMLTAMVLDENFGPVDGAVEVEFLAADGSLIATGTTDRGMAATSVVLEVVEPVATAVTATTIRYGDDSTGPGFAIAGTGFSRDAVVRLDGDDLNDLGIAMGVTSSEEILFADPGLEGTHRIVVENPHGWRTDELAFEP